MIDIDGFDLATYGKILDGLAVDHEVLRFKDAKKELPSRFVLLRHDIDFSPRSALAMAEFEAARNMRASYFLLLSSPYYNLMEPEWSGFPKRLIELGHEVGLHYDIRALEQVSGIASLAERFEFHVSVLGRLCGAPVELIAMHNPSIIGKDLDLPVMTGLVNAYAPRFTRDISYYSDSAGAWRGPAFEALSTGRLPAQLQLLIHPFLWAQSAGTRWDRLRAFFADWTDRMQQREDYIAQAWAKHSGVLEHDARTR